MFIIVYENICKKITEVSQLPQTSQFNFFNMVHRLLKDGEMMYDELLNEAFSKLIKTNKKERKHQCNTLFTQKHQ